MGRLRRRGRAATALALLFAAAAAPGCVISVGSTSSHTREARLRSVEERVERAEKELGICTEGGPQR